MADVLDVQRMAALGRANEIRFRRAAMKRDLKASRVKLADILIDVPEWCESMIVIDLLVAAPKIGGVRAKQALAKARISPAMTLGGLTERQRADLVARLR